MAHMGGLGGINSWGMMRSARKRDELAGKKVGRETALRVLRFARPYRRIIALFLVFVVASSIIAVVTPVLAGNVINTIFAAQPDAARVVITLALVIAGLAVLDAGFSLVQRFLSARIGESMIFDLRTQVYDHVQRMPLQFFTRTQTGALVSRLNNDVLGAQQAFTSTLSGTRRQHHLADPHGRRDVPAVVAGHRCCRWCWCRPSCCRPAWSGAAWPRSRASPTSSTRR